MVVLDSMDEFVTDDTFLRLALSISIPTLLIDCKTFFLCLDERLAIQPKNNEHMYEKRYRHRRFKLTLQLKRIVVGIDLDKA